MVTNSSIYELKVLNMDMNCFKLASIPLKKKNWIIGEAGCLNYPLMHLLFPQRVELGVELVSLVSAL